MKELKKYYRVVPLYNSNYKIEELKLYGPSRNCFLSKDEAEIDFLKAQKIALHKYSRVLEGLDRVRKELDIDFYFDYYMEGDTYGIYEDGCYIGLTVNDYNFKFLQ